MLNCCWALACLVFVSFTAACTRHEVHNHVAEPGHPESLERTVPTWVEEFSDGANPIEGSRPHILLISLDTLRADHLGAWGYQRPTSPFLDELARFGIRFDQTFSHSPITAPSHMSVFTGIHPSHHGVHLDGDSKPFVVHPASRELLTLPEALKLNGYRTAAWTGGGQMTEKAGFARGFDLFLDNLGTLTLPKTAEILNWFKANSDTPCFLFLHTYQIHDPYLPPSPYETVFSVEKYDGWVIGNREKLVGPDVWDFKTLHNAFWRKTGRDVDLSLVGPTDLDRLIELYDGGIRYSDDVLQGFFEDLRDDGLLANTLVVIFSDHGEEFLEHDGLLHKVLYRETLHVPLIFFWPARLPRGFEVETQVPLMDLTPTLLELAGLEPLPQSDARSLVPMFTGTDDGEVRPVFSEEPWVHKTPHRSFRNGEQTVYDHGNELIELFNTAEDPLETVDLSAENSEQALSLLSEMMAFLAGQNPLNQAPAETASELTDTEIEALRALGYLE
jgi:arylsulfatase A-like enzyme